MKRTEYSFVPGGLIAAFVLAVATQSPALAQADTKTLSGKTGTGKLMTRDELRACMKQQVSLAARKSELETRQSTAAAERLEIQKDTEALKADQNALASGKGQIDALNERVAAFTARAKALQERREEFERMGRSGPAADRERRLLDKEVTELKKEEVEIGAAREQIVTSSQASATAINARVEAQQRSAEGWNERSKKLSADQQAYEDERINWIDSCGNRRYREDDEKAIKAGK